MKRSDIAGYVEELVMPIMEEGNFELVDVEYVKEGANWYLRVYADKEGGINIDDCVTISRALEVKLDEKDVIEDAYILEVSSPGLGRQLKKDRDYKRSLGEEIEFKLYKARNKQKEFEGILKDFDEHTFTITLENEDVVFDRKDVAMMRLAVHF